MFSCSQGPIPYNHQRHVWCTRNNHRRSPVKRRVRRQPYENRKKPKKYFPMTNFHLFLTSTGGGRAARTSRAPPRERLNSLQLINESTPPSNPFSVEKQSFEKFARTHRKLSKSSSLPARSFREDKKKIFIVNTYKQPGMARLSRRCSVDKKNQFGKLFLSSLITNPSKNNYLIFFFIF